MKVGIVGMGYVGMATWDVIANHGQRKGWPEPVPFDTSEEEIKFWGAMSKDEINTCDIAFVCVPTPTGEHGEVYTSAVDDVLAWLEVPLVVIRSTMPATWVVGDSIIYQPEFIGESPFHRWHDEQDIPFVVAGGEKAQEVIDFWKPILGPEKSYWAVSWRTAAEVKYAVNCFSAVKTAFWNEYLSTCEDSDAVRNVIIQVPWIESYGTLPLGKVGGKCLPKDLKAWTAVHKKPIAEAALGYMSADDQAR